MPGINEVMRVLVTGGAGFIGSHLAEKLAVGGEELTILDNFDAFYPGRLKRDNWKLVVAAARRAKAPKPSLLRADICNAKQLEKKLAGREFDQIVHLAARAGVRPSILQPELYFRTNVLGTLNLLEWARGHGVKKVVLGSSSSVYGVNERVPFSETDPITRTISPYASSKLAAEQVCSNYSHLYGISCICLRFFTVYGPRQRPDLAIHKFASNIMRGKPIEQFGDGTSRRDYTYIDDTVEGVLAAMRYNKPFDIFNLGENETVELRYLIGQIEQVLGRKAEVRLLPSQPGDVPVTFADISKARALLGYTPKVKIQEGLKKFAEWFLAGKSWENGA
jgi:UDP-glucuronate 4-epimerase